MRCSLRSLGRMGSILPGQAWSRACYLLSLQLHPTRQIHQNLLIHPIHLNRSLLVLQIHRQSRIQLPQLQLRPVLQQRLGHSLLPGLHCHLPVRLLQG